ncbi:hypothetical protein N7931_06085 [Catenovulum sp. 2E275]|uniref:hypothetical protein n=1 Tax=Catenovulum sp. 2E275 TaxID=2980497 RepID=UPI0021D05F43|nr:hypothetical protein [Catenovulum sp. 2E275]MCU4675198.1 hypothetical protein [Catenovulum sp. 2E275]
MSINNVTSGLNASILTNTFNQPNNLLQQVTNQSLNNQAISKEELLAGVAKQQIGLTSNLLSGLNDGNQITDQLVSFSVNANNSLAANKLPDEYANVVGSLIDVTI